MINCSNKTDYLGRTSGVEHICCFQFFRQNVNTAQYVDKDGIYIIGKVRIRNKHITTYILLLKGLVMI